MKHSIITLIFILLTSPLSACMIDQLVGETNNGVNWPTAAPKWGQSFVACDDGDVWEIAFWPQWTTSGLHTLILTDINCVTMWTVNNINITSNGSQITVDLATGSGTSRTVTSGTSYIFQLIGPAGTNLQLNLSWTDPYPAGADRTDGCASYGLDWWFRVSIDEPLSSLPIELSAFDAKVVENGAAVELNFKTQSEIGSSHFEIENSSDGSSFYAIGTIEAEGYSSIEQSYTFLHQYPRSGNNYYRIKQVDEDESFEYSDVVYVRVESKELSYRIAPNPTQRDIEIFFNQTAEKNLSLCLFNKDGKMVGCQDLVNGASKISFDGSNLPLGIYFLQALENGEPSWIEKVLKQ